VRFFATTIAGLEDVAASEVSDILGVDAEVDVARVFFDSTQAGCAILNYSARCLNKVYLLLERCRAGGLREIEATVGGLRLADYIDRDQSFAVRAERHGSHGFTSLDIAAVVGRAIIESYKASTGVRLRVDLSNPDVEFLAILRGEEFILGINTTGISLHHRYYRVRHHRAGLSPTVAHSMLILSGWKTGEALLDPFCGSGTIVIEAAIRALNIHPGLRMGGLAMERLRFFEARELEELAERLREEEGEPRPLGITGIDASPRALKYAEKNLASAGLAACVELKLGDALSIEKYVRGPYSRVVCNPPFGVRMGLRDPWSFYAKAFTSIRRASPGASLTVIVSKPVVAERALEEAGWAIISERRVLLGSMAAYIICAAD